MKANVTSFDSLSQPISISVSLCKQSYQWAFYTAGVECLLQCWCLFCRDLSFCNLFCSEWQFWSMWPTKGVQVLMLEPRNKRLSCWLFKYKCNSSSSEFQEMVGKSVTISRQLEPGGGLTLGGHHIEAEHLEEDCTKPGCRDLGTSGNPKEAEWSLSAIAIILGTHLCRVYIFRTLCITNSRRRIPFLKWVHLCAKMSKWGTHSLLRCTWGQAIWVFKLSSTIDQLYPFGYWTSLALVSLSVKWK